MMISLNSRLRLRNTINDHTDIFIKYISKKLGSEPIKIGDGEITYKVKKSHLGKDFENTSLYYIDLLEPAISDFFRDPTIVTTIVNSLCAEYNKEFMLKEIDAIINNSARAMQLFNIKAFKGNVITISY